MFTLETSLIYKRRPEFFVDMWGFAAPYHKEVEHEDGTIHKELVAVYGLSNSYLGLKVDIALRKKRSKADFNAEPEKIKTWKQAEKYADNLPVNKRKVITNRRFKDPEAVMDTLSGYQTAEPHTELVRGRADVWEDAPVINGFIGVVAVGHSQDSYIYDNENQTWHRNEATSMRARRSKGIIMPGYIRAHHDYVNLAPALAQIDLTTPDSFQIDNPYGLNT